MFPCDEVFMFGEARPEIAVYGILDIFSQACAHKYLNIYARTIWSRYTPVAPFH